MPICSSGISSDLSRSFAAVRAYVPLFFFSLPPAFLPRACPGFPGIPPLCLSCVLFSCPSCLLPSALLSCLLLLSSSLRSPPLLPARTVSSLCSLSACPSGSALLVLLQLLPGFCFFLPLPLPLLPSLRLWIPAALLSEECRIFVPCHLYFCVFQKKLSGAGTIS